MHGNALLDAREYAWVQPVACRRSGRPGTPSDDAAGSSRDAEEVLRSPPVSPSSTFQLFSIARPCTAEAAAPNSTAVVDREIHAIKRTDEAWWYRRLPWLAAQEREPRVVVQKTRSMFC